MFSWDNLKRPILALAPMAGYTDSPFRQLVKEICPSVVCFTELTSVDGLLRENKATMRQISFNPDKERPLIVQLFGKKPENFKKATLILTELNVDAIDINIGCPARKIVNSDNGSALLKNPGLAAEIVHAVSESTRLPVSIKMRIGTNSYNPDKFFSFGLAMQDAGAKLITVHGRTAKQMYGATADWNPIYELKRILKIPVIGNGDIKTGADAVKKLGNLDGVMVGRGSFGNPWIFHEIENAFANVPYKPLTFVEKLPWIKRHIELSCEFKGEHYGMMEMRKQLAWYVKGLKNASQLRQKLVAVSSKAEAMAILERVDVLLTQNIIY